MSIETIIGRRDALLEAIDKDLAFATPKAEVLKRPIAQQESYVASLTSRIEALEALRKQQNERIDSDIKALKADLEAAKTRLEADRKVLAPAVGETDTPPRRTASAGGARTRSKPA